MSENSPLLSRREFIGTALSSSMIAATTSPVFGDEHIAKTVDVVIIGAGLARLTAAVELRKAGRSVCVVEGTQTCGRVYLD